ncbi:PREDICTED: uncharacterized protein LOC108974239 [Bactrocera latifrons]|uniref:uncharacterized protein LOC108974239 n=1 Tax=Bactrocera latifrons TaxID=174628 RepID=UPI0008DDC6D0|nr:PREDICTED: uncharacterized protein LOC108974239 [Bactrocera latifrons]
MAGNKQRKAWMNRDESVLIDLWRERAGDLRRVKGNSQIYADISVQMAHKFTPKEVHVKIRNLTQKYREERKKVGSSGGSPSGWKLFDAVHQIIELAAGNVTETCESFTVSSIPTASPVSVVPVSELLCAPLMASTSSASLSPLDSSISAVGTSRKRNYKGEILKVAKEQNELLKTVVEDGKKLTERVVNAIELQSNNTKEFIDIMKILLEKIKKKT